MLEGARVSLAFLARNVSRCVAQAQREPVVVTGRGAPVAVLVSAEAYARAVDRAGALEDLYWTAVALRQEAAWQAAGRPVVSLEEVARRAGSDSPPA